MAGVVNRVADLKGNPRPIDPNVKVPAAVQRAADAADAAQRAAYPDQSPPASTPPAPAGDTIVIADPPAPQPTPPAPVTPTGNEPPAPQPTPPATPPQSAPPAPTDMELEIQRVRSEEGRRRKAIEIQLGQALDRIGDLEAALQAARSAPPASTTPTAPPQLITEQERNEFGNEMLDVMGRRARETISPELAELRSMMSALQDKLQGTVQQTTQTARQTMLSTLDRELPEWRGINVQQEFKDWLALPDPYFGATRHSALTKAFELNDTTRVLNFFKGFVSDLAASTPAAPQPPAPATPQAPPKPGLESLAAPGRARTSAQPNAPAEKQIITTADVQAFYTAVRQGMYRGREAEKEALEQELFAAQREGRVRAV